MLFYINALAPTLTVIAFLDAGIFLIARSRHASANIRRCAIMRDIACRLITMPEATFYQLADSVHTPAAQLQTVCRVVYKAYLVAGRASVLCSTAELAKRLDDLLWTFNQGSFIPHMLAPSDEAVVLATELALLPHDRDLILLVDALPDGLERFAQVRDFIMPERKDEARQRYRQLKQMGFNLTVHTLTEN